MIKSFLDLVSESAEITEMGVQSVANISGSEIASVRKFSQSLSKLVKALRNLKSSDITMEQYAGERKYFPRFNNPEIIQLMQEVKSLNHARFLEVVGKWRDLYPNDSDAIYMKTDGQSSHQRSHFPNGGIPTGLRGTGLGYKLYRALLRKVGYISSNTSGTREKDNVWASMLEAKRDASGNLTEEDAHAIVGSSNWMAIDKNIQPSTKISAATNFIDNAIGVANTSPNRFDMDDELFAILPEEFISTLDRSYLDSLVTSGRQTREKIQSILAASSRAQIAARERAEAEARENRERAAREERQLRKRLIARLARFGADPDAEWDVGDFIVVKEYLYRADYDPLPIREVAAFNNGVYYAVSINQMLRVNRNEISPYEASDNRTTRDKTTWVKVNLDEIPDLDNVNLTAPEKEYIESKLSPETQSTRQAEEEEETQRQTQDQAEQNQDRATDRATFGNIPSTANAIKAALLDRPRTPNFNLLKNFRANSFYDRLNFIVLGPVQRDLMRQSFAIPVYIPWFGLPNRPNPATISQIIAGTARLTNAVTGEQLEGPYAGLGLTAYPLSGVTIDDKIGARARDFFYIAGHQNVFGVIAKSEYGTLNTSRQPFIYFSVYGYAGRSVSVRLDLLKKMGAPQTI